MEILAIGLACTLLGIAVGLLLGRSRNHNKSQFPQTEPGDYSTRKENRYSLIHLKDNHKLRYLFLSEIVVGVAHEFATPLGNALLAENVLSGQLNGLSETESCVEKDEIQSPLNIIEVSIERMIRLLERFKDLNLNNVVVEHYTLNADELINSLLIEAAEHFQVHRDEIGLTLHTSIKDMQLPNVLNLVLRELIENALCHSFQLGSKHTGERDPGTTGNIHIDIERAPEGVTMRFACDGLPIHATMADTIFEPFVTSKRFDGRIGLGLFLVRGIMEHVLNGSIELSYPLPEKGIAYSLRWPTNYTDSYS